MNRFIKISILLMVLSCSISKRNEVDHETIDLDQETIDIRKLPKKLFVSDAELYNISYYGFNGTDTTIIGYNLNKIASKTTYAINSKGEVSNLKFGPSEVYNDQEILIEKGNYQIGKYIDCCTGGLCQQFYSFKTGKWTYYHHNGALRANVYYDQKKIHMNTTCEGGTELKSGVINTDKSQFYNNEGIKTMPSDELLKELESVK